MYGIEAVFGEFDMERGNGLRFYGNRDVSKLCLNDLIMSKIDAIIVLSKMVGKERYFKGSFFHMPDDHEEYNISCAFRSGVFTHLLQDSSFVWRVKKDNLDFEYVVFGCNKDFTIKYPVQKISVDKNSNPFKSIAIFNNEEELARELDEILCGM